VDEDLFNMSVRKFLKKVGVTGQREIEQAIRRALAEGRLAGAQRLAAEVRLSVPAAGLEVRIDGEIELR